MTKVIVQWVSVVALSAVAIHAVAIPAVAQTSKAATKAATKPAPRAAMSQAARDSVAADSAVKAFLKRDEQFFADRVAAQRRLLFKGASWADLGDRCGVGTLRVFAKDTTPAQRDSLQQIVQHMEQTIIGRGVGSRLDTPDARALLRVIVGWEAGIDRPIWDADDKVARKAIATGMTGEYADPAGPGCLKSPMMTDTVTFVIPGFTDMEFPKAPTPRVKVYFGPEGQKRARDEFYTAVGRDNPNAELTYIVIAPIVIWREWALVGIERPREKGGIEVGVASNGGAVYLMRKVGTQWRLTSIVRTWGS